jgi:hypothetical protein
MNAGTAINVHKNDENLGGTIAGIYNAYKSTDGTGALAGYTSLVPVAYDNIRKNSLLNGHFTTGATVASSDRVMCLSCHRAHASAFDHAIRWPQLAEELTFDNGAGIATYASSPTGSTEVPYLTATEMQAGMYDRAPAVFGIGQKALCNKCHAKD